MHFSRAFVAAAAVYLCPLVSAAEDEAAAPTPASSIARPSFTPTTLQAPFFEQFTDGWESRWQASHAKKADTEEEWAYVGTWDVEEPTVFPGIVGDKALILKDKAAHHAISAKFAKKIDPKGKNLVVQYEVKPQDGLECGGAYLKLLQENKALHQDEFSNASPYVIMFGPDKCGSTNKVHFIFRHKNPKTGEYEEKHMIDAPQMKNEKVTSLYTLIVKPDNTFQVKINGEAVTNGTLHENFQPAVNPDKEIDDPKDKKPADWVDDAKMKDPDATKPEDWDEEAPFEVEDEEATKPDDWLDDEPQIVPDPEAEKPEDWDDEEDGDWEAPSVPNPKCAEVSGCGEWKRPTKRNPDYKGKWSAPFIDNPAYKGLWKPRKVKNPDYFEDKTPSNFEPIGAVGFELWTMQGNIAFDNLYIGHSIEDADKLKAETFDIKYAIESKEQEAAAPKFDEADKKSPFDLSFTEDPVAFIKSKVDLFVTLAQKDPLTAIKTVPEVSGTIGVVLGSLLLLLLGGGGAAAAQNPKVQEQAAKAKAKAVDAKDKAAEAVASGADAAQAEINKRTTRSSHS